MATAGTAAPSLADLTRALSGAVEELEAALTDEAAALCELIPDVLLNAVARKRRAVRALAEISRDGRVAVLAASSDPQHVALVDRLRCCRDRNLTAGAAVATAKRTNDGILALLGQAGEPAPYGPPGTTSAPAPGRDFGTA